MIPKIFLPSCQIHVRVYSSTLFYRLIDSLLLRLVGVTLSMDYIIPVICMQLSVCIQLCAKVSLKTIKEFVNEPRETIVIVKN